VTGSGTRQPRRFYNGPVADSEKLGKVREHLQLYDHPLLSFSARHADADERGPIEICIDLKHCTVPVHTYRFQIHPRDLDHPQFAWNLQRQLYDALHDYFIEMFTRTPQDHGASAGPTAGPGQGS